MMMKRGPMLSLLWGCGTLMPSVSLSSSASQSESPAGRRVPPIVYTIAGSDSGGGAGIQADLHAIHSMACHGCSAITCLTAQNSQGVTEVHAPPSSFLGQQLQTLTDDLPPRAVKIGMLGTRELAQQVGTFLQHQQTKNHEKQNVWVVLDPVMISTSGHRLIEDDAQTAMVQSVFPHANVITPNLYEAQAFLLSSSSSSKSSWSTRREIESAAHDFLTKYENAKAVLIKGGHVLFDQDKNDKDTADPSSAPPHRKALDYFLARNTDNSNQEPRLCDGHLGIWLESNWFDTVHTHGTGCTLSSSMAAALALGEEARQQQESPNAVVNNSPPLFSSGAMQAMDCVDASCLAKAYVTSGIQQSVGLGQGPGPVAHTGFPSSHETFPSIRIVPWNPLEKQEQPSGTFTPLLSYFASQTESQKKAQDPSKDEVMGRIYPIADSVEWVHRLCQVPGITDIQLRLKGETDDARIAELVQQAQDFCTAASKAKEQGRIRLWINDYWQAAIQAKCFGVHLGQEDLYQCWKQGGLAQLQEHNMALGVSTHSYGELAVALGLKPSYVSLGPIFGTQSKTVHFGPQGLETITQWRQFVPPRVPLVVIGGIGTPGLAKAVRQAGADSVAVIGAVTNAPNVPDAVDALLQAMET